MSCSLTTGYSFGCKDNQSGIAKVYLIKYGNVISITEQAGEVTAIATSEAWHEYTPPKNTTSYDETMEVNDAGAIGYVQTLSIQLPGVSTAMRREIQKAAKIKLMVVILDRGGKYWLVGRYFGARVKSVASSYGRTASDLNGYTLTIEALDREMAPMITAFTGSISGCTVTDDALMVITDDSGLYITDDCVSSTGDFDPSDFSITDFL